MDNNYIKKDILMITVLLIFVTIIFVLLIWYDSKTNMLEVYADNLYKCLVKPY